MTVNVLYAGSQARWADYADALPKALAEKGVAARLGRDFTPEQTDYMVFAPNGPVSDFTPYKRCKAVLSLWAGVETIVGNQTLTQPLTRMADEGLRRGMTEYVVGHAMRHHLGLDVDIRRTDRIWEPHVPPLAPERKVTVMGLGALGAAAAEALVALGFDVTGWSARPKDIAGVYCLAGFDNLPVALDGAEIVVLLLPATPETESVINAATLARMARGAVIINPGRGTLIDDDALLSALDSGQIGHATLDVFRIEPLPQDHPYWAHPNVTVTPHMASETRTISSARHIAENIRRSEAGAPLLNLVDRVRGY